MDKKHLYDLKEEDFIKYPLWFFPMDEDIDDELMVAPVLDKEVDEFSDQIIVRAVFIDKFNNKYNGFVYSFDESFNIENMKPAMFFDGKVISFWGGVSHLSTKNFDTDESFYQKFPLKVVSEKYKNIKPIEGIINGFYYFDEEFNVVCDEG